MYPNMRKCLVGWTKKKTVYTYTESTIDYENVLTLSETITAKINYQPTPPQRVDKKPEEERRWIWWDIWVDKSLNIGFKDWIIIDDKSFQVMVKHDWKESGFYHYEVIEAFMPATA